ncbi:hypothetical protein ACE6H2_022570 [Prunus campanulata]
MKVTTSARVLQQVGFRVPVSPQRSKAGDPFPMFKQLPSDFHDTCPLRLSPNNIAHSPSHSPLPSSTSRRPRSNHKNSNGNVFALHHKSFTEGFSYRGESSKVNAYPLPLLPGAVVHSLAASLRCGKVRCGLIEALTVGPPYL